MKLNLRKLAQALFLLDQQKPGHGILGKKEWNELEGYQISQYISEAKRCLKALSIAIYLTKGERNAKTQRSNKEKSRSHSDG